MAKIRLRNGSEPSPLPTLAHVLERILRLLHPFMPFITEEIWQTLKSELPEEGDAQAESIMVAPYPASGGRTDPAAEEEIALVQQAVRAVRNTRAQLRIPAAQHLEALVEANGQRAAIEAEADVIRAMSRVEPLRIVEGGALRQAQDEQDGGASVTLVATSNIEPSKLYVDGLQRVRFLPAIELIERHTKVIRLDSGPDYRLRALERARTWFEPLGPDADRGLAECFRSLASGHAGEDGALTILGRPVPVVRHAGGRRVVRIRDPCAGGLRSVADYIEIARDFHTVVLSGVPRARRRPS